MRLALVPRCKSWWTVIVVLVVAAISPATSGTGAVVRPNVVPAPLVGTWKRTVTTADVNREHAKGVAANTVYTLIIKKSGVGVLGSSVAGFQGKIVPGGANRVHINIGTPVANVYVWHVSGRLLTFKKVKDSEPDRAAAVVGVWRRT